MLALLAGQSDNITFPKAAFVNILNKQIAKHVRPLTKKHRGKRLREAKPLMTTDSIWQDAGATFSCERATLGGKQL